MDQVTTVCVGLHEDSITIFCVFRSALQIQTKYPIILNRVMGRRIKVLTFSKAIVDRVNIGIIRIK
jgi:hypothetical protein